MKELKNSLLSFLKEGLSPSHVVENISYTLLNHGAHEISEDQVWNLENNVIYFFKKNGALITFNIKNIENGINIASAHTDSPLLKLKLDSEKLENNFKIITTEVYGNPILYTFLDKELICAGEVFYEKDNKIRSKQIKLDTISFIIPSLAIHMNKTVNEGIKLDKQEHMKAIILSDDKSENLILKHCAKQLKIEENKIIYADLFLMNKTQATEINDYILSPKLDNLAGCHAVLSAFLNSNENKTKIAVFFDGEEIGSRIPEGANSNFLDKIIDRIIENSPKYEKDLKSIIRAKSHCFSIDAAHSIHPNFKDKHDPSYSPSINEGFCFKLSAGFSYSQNNMLFARAKKYCEDNKIKFNLMTNKSNIRSGSTVGPFMTSISYIPGIDLGIPILAMHSNLELSGILDQHAIIEALKGFYGF